MTVWFKVKDDGTASGDAGRVTSQPTGSFAADGIANHYASVSAAMAATTPPVSGDFIIESDLHVFALSSTTSYVGAWVNNIFIISVDDANMDDGRTSGNFGEETQTTSGQNIVIENVFMSGNKLNTGNDIIFRKNCKFDDGILSSDGTDDKSVSTDTDGTAILITNSEIEINNANGIPVHVSNAVTITIINTIFSSTVGDVPYITEGGFGNGGGSLIILGCDLSTVTGTLIKDIGSTQAVDDYLDVRFDMCKLASGVAFTNETFKNFAHRALFTRCSDISSTAEYQYHLHAFGGDVDDDSAIFRNESPAFTDSNQKISYKIVTNSDASLGSPLWFDMPLNKWSVLSSASTDTLRFYITSNTALTDKDIYIEISYPDGTNKQTPNFLTSAPATVGGTLDLMATGTTLTTDGTSTWTGGLSNLYQIDLDTSVDGGADTYPIIKVYVTIPSVTINIAMDFTPL